MKHYKSIQLRVRESTHYYIMLTASQNRMTGAEFILRSLAKYEDEKLAKAIDMELKHRPKPGIPQTRRMYLKLFLKRLPPKFTVTLC
jgi:hypothetical protein